MKFITPVLQTLRLLEQLLPELSKCVKQLRNFISQKVRRLRESSVLIFVELMHGALSFSSCTLAVPFRVAQEDDYLIKLERIRGWRKLLFYVLQFLFMLRIAYFVAAPVLLYDEFALVSRKGNFTLDACVHSILSLLAAMIFVACTAFAIYGEDAVQLYNAMAMLNRNFTGMNIEWSGLQSVL